MSLTVERLSGGYLVFEGNRAASGRFTNRELALERRDKMLAERSSNTETRKCMTCSNPFESEGAHNRMCSYCRTSASRLDRQMI